MQKNIGHPEQDCSANQPDQNPFQTFHAITCWRLTMGGEKILTQHVKDILVDCNVLLFELFAKEIPHDAASAAARLRIVIIECFRMSCLQQPIELGPVLIGEADKPAHEIHPW